ncbi:hypothetical protein LCGC14_2149540, partial [marine sediment metagenome]
HKILIIITLLVSSGPAFNYVLNADNEVSALSVVVSSLYVNSPTGPVNPGVTVRITITGSISSQYDLKTVTLYYRLNGGSFAYQQTTVSGSYNLLKIIGSYSENDLVEYYAIAKGFIFEPLSSSTDRHPNSGYQSFTVVSNNEAPEIVLVSPTSGTTFPAGTDITVSATITDPDGNLHSSGKDIRWDYKPAGGSWTQGGLDVDMDLWSGSIYQFTFSQNSYGTMIRYLIKAYDTNFVYTFSPGSDWYYLTFGGDNRDPWDDYYNIPTQLVSGSAINHVTFGIRDLDSGFSLDGVNKEIQWRQVGGSWNSVTGVYESGTALDMNYGADLTNLPFGMDIEIRGYFADIKGNDYTVTPGYTRSVLDGEDPIVVSGPTLIGPSNNVLPTVWQVDVNDFQTGVLACYLDYSRNGAGFVEASTMQLISGTNNDGIYNGTVPTWNKTDTIQTQVRCRDNAAPANWVTYTNPGSITLQDGSAPYYNNFQLEVTIDDENDALVSVEAWDDLSPLSSITGPTLYYAYSSNGGSSYSSWISLGVMSSYDNGQCGAICDYVWSGILPKESITNGWLYKFRVSGVDLAGNPGTYDDPGAYLASDGTAPVFELPTNLVPDESNIYEGDFVELTVNVTDNHIDYVKMSYRESLSDPVVWYDLVNTVGN